LLSISAVVFILPTALYTARSILLNTFYPYYNYNVYILYDNYKLMLVSVY